MGPTETTPRRGEKIWYENQDLDFYLSWLAFGTMSYGGAAIGEVAHALNRIDPDQISTWIDQWTQLSKRLELWAHECVEHGQRVNARDAYLRAWSYHRAAMICMRMSDERYQPAVKRMDQLFRRAAALCRPVIEWTPVPFENTQLPAYFLPATDGSGPRPTLIVLGGNETYVSDMYFLGGAQTGPERGYNVLIVDMPGQGTLPNEGVYHRYDTEKPVGAVVDHLLSRSDVDGKRIALFGQSLGGYLATRAASHEHRLAAAAATTPLIDYQKLVHAWAPRVLTEDARFCNVNVAELYQLVPEHGVGEDVLAVIEKVAFTHHVKTTGEIIQKLEPWKADASKIQCPYLAMLGQGEGPEFHRQTHEAYESVTSPKRLRVFTADEGADSHIQLNNLRLGYEVLYGWLDEVMDVDRSDDEGNLAAAAVVDG